MKTALEHEPALAEQGHPARPRSVLIAPSRLTFAALLVTALIHGVGIVVLWELWQARPTLITPPPPLEISLITPPRQAVPREQIPPPRPVPTPVTRTRPAPTPPPVRSAEEPVIPMPTPTPVTREPEPMRQTPPVVATPPPEPRPAPVEAPAPPAPVTPPSFGAAYLNNPTPPYPPRARKFNLQGTVMLRVLVSPAGLPEQISILTSSGTPLLDETAVSTVRQWTFVPARQGDRPVAGSVNVPIRFVLN